MNIFEDLIQKKYKISVVGLGYVGLPLGAALSRHFSVIGFDINKRKIDNLKNGFDESNQLSKEELENADIYLTTDEFELASARFHIVAVPTPVHKDKSPDIQPLINASKSIGRYLARDSIIVYESTVYPGLIEEICIPVLEQTSGLKCKVDFKVGYSPERVSPGDKIHNLSNTMKLVSAIDEESLEIVYKVYEKVIHAGLYKTSSIKVAEAAKIIENCQRDINIAFINEISMILDKLGLDTKEVLEAAATKWNFHKFFPGLVGGHCISVDPYYLIEQSKRSGYVPKVLTSGREINEYIPYYIKSKLITIFHSLNKKIQDSTILVMGITFKENCPDSRNTKVIDLIELLKDENAKVFAFDPVANRLDVWEEYGVELSESYDIPELDAIIVAVSHDEFRNISLEQLLKLYKKESIPILMDIKGIYNKAAAWEKGIEYWTL